jgi:hypothetical protein
MSIYQERPPFPPVNISRTSPFPPSVLMGIVKMEWQDTDYVLGYFGKSKTEGMRKYESFVEEGFTQGQREELTTIRRSMCPFRFPAPGRFWCREPVSHFFHLHNNEQRYLRQKDILLKFVYRRSAVDFAIPRS